MSRESIIRSIVQRELKNQGIGEQTVQAEAPELYQAACEQFGTWETALRYAGVTRRRLRAEEISGREELVQRLRKHVICGRSLIGSRVQQRHTFLYRAVVQHFGSWKKGLVAAGVDLKHARSRMAKPRCYDRSKLLEEMRAWAREGHSLEWTDICFENQRLATMARQAFMGWRQALVVAGLATESTSADGETPWNPEWVMERLRRRHQEGRSLCYDAARSEERMLTVAALQFFRNWRAAIEAAGIDSVSVARRRGRKSRATKRTDGKSEP